VEGEAPVSIRTVAVFPEPTPYRTPVFDAIADTDDVELTVLYAARTVAGRTWETAGRHRAVYLSGVRIPGAARLLRHDYPISPRVWSQLSAISPQCVVASGWSIFASQAAICWARAHRVPYVLVVESNDLGARTGWRRFVKGLVVPRIVKRAAMILVVGSAARRSMLDRGADPDAIDVFANTVDVEAFAARAAELRRDPNRLRERFALPMDRPVVVCVARLAAEKGLDTLVRAASLARSRPVLFVVGEGPERTSLEAQAALLGVDARFVGDLPWARISEAYAAADIFALLSRHEPWGVAVTEAAASGLPLVLSDQVGAGFDLLRPGENGVRVAADDAEAAAVAFDELAASPERRAANAHASATIASSWGYDASVRAFVAAVARSAAGDAH
jgi:glycosyltransferase involved in cell wall biosynthesis